MGEGIFTLADGMWIFWVGMVMVGLGVLMHIKDWFTNKR